MDWDDLRHLEAIHRTGSVGRAARELRTSASTVYRRVAALEAAVGQPCIVRGVEPAVLTDAGRSLARVAERTRVSLGEVMGGVRARATEIGGTVSVTTVEGLLPFLVEPIDALGKRHPALQVMVHLADTGPSVRRREVDVAISIIDRPPAGCFGRRVLRIPYGVFGTAEAIAAKPRRWIVRGAALRHAPEAAWEAVHAEDAAVGSATFAGIVAFVAAGTGIGLLPRMIAARHPGLVELPEYREAAAPLERTGWILVHPEQRKTPRVVALVDALTKSFSRREVAGA